MDKNQKVQSRFCVRAGVSRAYCEDFWIYESPLDLIRKFMDFLRKSTGLLALRARSPWTSGFQKHCFWPRRIGGDRSVEALLVEEGLRPSPPYLGQTN